MSARVRCVACVLPLLAALAASPRAQAIVKVNDDVNFRFGVLGQSQAEAIDDPVTDLMIRNLFLRRMRLLVGGQVAKNVAFFLETDAPNLGKSVPGGRTSCRQ